MTTTVASLLSSHNALAAQVDAKPLAKWSASKAKLQERIDALQAQVDALAKRDANTFRIADLAREFGKNAKVTRAKARRLLAAGKIPAPAVRANVYHNDQRDAVIGPLFN